MKHKNTFFCFNLTARSVDKKNREVYLNAQRDLEIAKITDPQYFQGRQCHELIDQFRRKVTEEEEHKMSFKQKKKHP